MADREQIADAIDSVLDSGTYDGMHRDAQLRAADAVIQLLTGGEPVVGEWGYHNGALHIPSYKIGKEEGWDEGFKEAGRHPFTTAGNPYRSAT